MRLDDPQRQQHFGRPMYREPGGRWVAALAAPTAEFDFDSGTWTLVGFWCPRQSTGRYYAKAGLSSHELEVVMRRFEADPEGVMAEEFGWKWEGGGGLKIDPVPLPGTPTSEELDL